MPVLMGCWVGKLSTHQYMVGQDVMIMDLVLVKLKDVVFGTLDVAVKQNMDTDMYLVVQEHFQ